MAWACDRCDTTHTQNPAERRNCGHKIFSPVSDSELKQRGTSTGSNRRADIESDQLIGTVTDPDYRSSPDVTVSGDIAEETTEQSVVDDPTPTPGRFNSVYYCVRATLLAPLGLLRQYVAPILAFLIVFGGNRRRLVLLHIVLTWLNGKRGIPVIDATSKIRHPEVILKTH